jgi:hypothetical protein
VLVVPVEQVTAFERDDRMSRWKKPIWQYALAQQHSSDKLELDNSLQSRQISPWWVFVTAPG